MTFLKDENGQGMVEYALILGLIAIVAVVTLVFLGPKIKNLFNSANKKITEPAE
jgi:pilus assembly protein Flp/PilA